MLQVLKFARWILHGFDLLFKPIPQMSMIRGLLRRSQHFALFVMLLQPFVNSFYGVTGCIILLKEVAAAIR